VEDLLWEDRLSVRVGQLAVDSEFAGTEQGSLFVNATLGWPAILGVNVPAPAYPVGALGARVAMDLGERFDLRLACYNGDPDPVDESGAVENPHGFYYRWKDTFIISDLGTYWPGEDEEAGLAGGVRVGVWYHTGLFEHQRRDTTGRSLADPSGSGEPGLMRGNGGFYVTVEQELTRENSGEDEDHQGLGAFARVGGADGDRNPVQVYVDGGLTYRGLIPGRDADVCGVGVAYGGMSRDLRRLGVDGNEFGQLVEPLPDYEMVVEGAYQLEVRSGWVLQGVLQYIVHPGGSTALEDALVLGVRTTLTL
jgi:porin